MSKCLEIEKMTIIPNKHGIFIYGIYGLQLIIFVI